MARLTVLFGLLALVLTSVGLYGITSYQTAQRSHEVGLHMAFGAGQRHVLGLVMRKALVQFALGLILGIPITLIGARLIANQLYLVQSTDLWNLFSAALALAASVTAAGIIPASRATSIDPIRALRNE